MRFIHCMDVYKFGDLVFYTRILSSTNEFALKTSIRQVCTFDSKVGLEL